MSDFAKKTAKTLGDLLSKKELNLTRIAEKTGISYWRLNRIKREEVKGNELDLIKLSKAFPEIVEKIQTETQKDDESKLEERVKQLENDNRLLKEMMIKMLNERGDTEKANLIKKLI